MPITLNGTTGITTPKLDALDLELGSKNVVERGSNANGEYVRFADGTQICWNFSLVSHGTTAVQYVKTFPAAFIAQPRVQADGNFWTAANSANGWAYVKVYTGGTSSSSGSFAVYSLNSSTASGDAETQYIAVGRWY